jgi:hypothetical protein
MKIHDSPKSKIDVHKKWYLISISGKTQFSISSFEMVLLVVTPIIDYNKFLVPYHLHF